MSSIIASYGNVALLNTGKQGILKKLDGNYYELLLGALGAQGNGGWIYDEKSCEEYLRTNQDFQNRLKQGRLRMEWGHPVRTPGMSDAAWMARVHTILESNTCAQIRAIHLSRDTLKDKNGKPLIAIIGEVCPSGKQAASVRDMFENPHEDVNASVRCFTYNNARTNRKSFTNVINWDLVNDPGIKETSKYNTPSLESAAPRIQLLDQTDFDVAAIREELIREHDTAISMESRKELLRSIDLIERGYTPTRLPKTLCK